MRRHCVVTLFVLVGLAAGGCSSGGGEAADAEAPAELCRTYQRFADLDDELLAPQVFDLSADELVTILDERSRATAAMADLADGELREALQPAATFDPAVDQILLGAWRDDRGRLRAVADAWPTKALEGHDELVVEDGTRIATRDWLSRSTQRRELLYVTCVEPALADGPVQDRAETPTDGLISYFRFTDIPTAAGERLAVTPEGDEVESPFVLPAGWRSPLYGDVVGERVVFNASHDERVGLLAFDRNGDAEVAYDGGTAMMCPSLSSDDLSILAPEQSFSGDERGVFEVRNGEAQDLGLDLALQGCAAEVGHDRLLVAPAAASLADPITASLMARDGSNLQSVDLPAHCNVVLSDVDAAGQNAALSVRCAHPGDSGLWTVDLDSLEASHLITGAVATPKWSPDGRWLAFAFAPVEQRSGDLAVWLVKADGTGARELVEHGAFPIWLPDR